LLAEEEHTLKSNIYFKNEPLLMLERAGFVDVTVHGDYTGEEATADHGVLVFIARKETIKMEPTDTLTVLFRHNLWANLNLLERCAELTSEQLQTTMVGGFGSIQDTLEHIIKAEQSYYSRISTGQPHYRSEDEPAFTIADMVESASTTGEGFIEWAPKVQAGDTVRIDWDGTPRDVPKTIILTQVINHATEHRAQVMAIMTQLGIEPPSLDSWTYFDQQGK
jgi:uncharacterized damage-inducible protein DinB